MPTIALQNFTPYYEFDYAADRPVLVLSHSLGMSLDMWNGQIKQLQPYFSLLRYDLRGHGKSSTPGGPYTIAQFGADMLRMLDHLNLARVHVCGLSLGGLIAQWVAVHAPQRVERVILSNTAARIGTASLWQQRIEAAQSGGIEPLVPITLKRWFTPEFRISHAEEVAAAARLLCEAHVDGYVASCAALRDADLRERVSEIAAPTLVLFGTQDPLTTSADAHSLATQISHAVAVGVHAAHLANVEAADAWTDAVIRFLSDAVFQGS